MDYTDPNVLCPKKDNKLNHSLTMLYSPPGALFTNMV